MPLLDVNEARLVRAIGEVIGYGRMMQLAEEQWRDHLALHSMAGGELTVGPAASQLVPCSYCSSRHTKDKGDEHCPWCRGAGRVTPLVDDVSSSPLLSVASDMLTILCELVDPDEFDKHPQDFVEPWHRARAIISRAQGFTPRSENNVVQIASKGNDQCRQS